jgi:hypothetical protein
MMYQSNKLTAWADEAGKFGIRLESSLIVKRVQTKRSFGGDIWLGFERLTCVPIQTKMALKSMLSKEEARWIKVSRVFRSGRFTVDSCFRITTASA